MVLMQLRLAEAGTKDIRLLPNFVIGPQEVDQVAGAEAQQLGCFAYPCLDRLHHIEDDANGWPKTRILATQIESATASTRILVIRRLADHFRGEPFRWELISDLQEQGLSQPA